MQSSKTGLNSFEQGVEGRRTAVDVTNGDCAWVHFRVASSRAAEFLRELIPDGKHFRVAPRMDHALDKVAVHHGLTGFSIQ